MAYSTKVKFATVLEGCSIKSCNSKSTWEITFTRSEGTETIFFCDAHMPIILAETANMPAARDRLLDHILGVVKRAEALNVAINPYCPDPRLTEAIDFVYPAMIEYGLDQLKKLGRIYETKSGYWKLTHDNAKNEVNK